MTLKPSLKSFKKKSSNWKISIKHLSPKIEPLTACLMNINKESKKLCRNLLFFKFNSKKAKSPIKNKWPD